MAANIHVVETEHNGWAVEVEGTDGATSHYPSEVEAISAAMEKAKRDKVEVFIHDRDGKVRERHPGDQDPRGAKG